jgi:hypothetical protein
VTPESNPLITVAIVLLAALIWRVWGLIPARRQRHYPAQWDSTHATCKCGYNSVDDYNLKTHFTEMGRAGF